jgi:hypothetical protein
VLTDWGDIATVMTACFVGILSMLGLVVRLESWLGHPVPKGVVVLPVGRERAEPPEPGDLAKLEELDELDAVGMLDAPGELEGWSA